jgi:DNA replicative helicase MCM subunit Mcm2 (Cdc46/Mcm family)
MSEMPAESGEPKSGLNYLNTPCSPKQGLSSPIPHPISQYYVFLASPGDVSIERQHVRQFFERYNQHTAQLWSVRFEVVDWQNYATIGVGRPQELITQQTLEKYHNSLALVIGVMGQRFGSPTGRAESGTEEEFNWAMDSHKKHGFPEIKWFFRKVDKLEIPTDPAQAREAIERWEKVLAFRQRMQDLRNPVFYTEYPSPGGFRDVFENDLHRWLADSARPWIPQRKATANIAITTLSPPSKYYENIERDFRRLDIAGIDNDRTFEIPLSEIYVRLRVMLDQDAVEETEGHEGGAIDIQTALLRYPKLVIVGDPGSGKSTFLKYIALMLARSFLTGNSGIALEKLCLPEPLPLPIFLSCWDLADFLRQRQQARLDALVEFIANGMTACDFCVSPTDVERLLGSGNCCLLFDGLDEAVSRLLEDCVERYSDDRFVVTSRIRAYTGDTILKGQFTRCDIQPFDADDRAEFIRNWVALLFRISPEDVETEETEARQEFENLTHSIEANDRIRPLAVNPLLLTVVAIVHWNRKRLPEQRVDLYDECVDVLLGQRKEAEHIRLSRRLAGLDEEHEEQTHEERAWVRKRFAEIALHILSQDGERDEATKADMIKLLVPRFIDQGATTEEQAAARAELFLERQELRSGLLVSRRAQSYRFVHLTFEEYLAAWQLSNMDFDHVAELIGPRLRMAKWFETLQLLGGQWAKESDEKANRFVAWLLDSRGITVSSQAPVVALCANVVKDISGVAELKPETRRTFKDAVEATLDAFREGSAVPAQTQLEILEALGQLGAAVKSHLIDATRASLFQVRRKAIEMLLPHLSDDELFGLDHILDDRSREPIKTFIQSLLDRDLSRSKAWLDDKASFTEKAAEAIYSLIDELDARFSRETILGLVRRCHRIPSWIGHEAIQSLARKWPDEAARRLLEWHAVQNKDGYALEMLAERWPDETTRKLVTDALQYEHTHVSNLAIRTLAEKWPDETTRKLLEGRALQDLRGNTRSAALEALVQNWPDETTRILLTECAVQDEEDGVRRAAFDALAEKWPDETTRRLLEERSVRDDGALPRIAALVALAEKWPDKTTREFLEERAIKDENEYVRATLLELLAENWPDEATRKLLEVRAVKDRNNYSRSVAFRVLAAKWPEKSTLRWLEVQVESFPRKWTRIRSEIQGISESLRKRLQADLPRNGSTT